MSFASETKTALASLPIKSVCCKKAELYGLFFTQSDFEKRVIRFSTDNEKIASLCSYLTKSVFGFESVFEDSEKLTRAGGPAVGYKFLMPRDCDVIKMTDCFSEYDASFDRLLKCDGCLKSFFRGLFLAVGTISDPNSGYHLEFAVSDEKKASLVCEYLETIGVLGRLTSRRGVCAIYVKESEAIEDFFTYIGAPQTSLTIMEVKIMREIRNNENRRNNCDTANIYKSTGAAIEQIKAINRLIEHNLFGKLPAELAETAKLRLDNPELSMSELAVLHDPPITKSGVSHRLSKIISFCEKTINSSDSKE